jgi:hypothetical protein
MDSNQANLDDIHERMMAKLNTHQERTMAYPGTTEIDPDPRKMSSAEEHHEIPNKEAAVAPVRGLKKRRRVRDLAAERRQKKRKRTRENCGSRKFATARRGIARLCRGTRPQEIPPRLCSTGYLRKDGLHNKT